MPTGISFQPATYTLVTNKMCYNLDNQEIGGHEDNVSNTTAAEGDNSAATVVLLGQKKNQLSTAFCWGKSYKRLYFGYKQPPSLPALQPSDPNRHDFVVDNTIDLIHAVLIKEKIGQVKKVG